MSFFRGFKEVFIFSKDEKIITIFLFAVIAGLSVFNFTNHIWVKPQKLTDDRLKKAELLFSKLKENANSETKSSFFEQRSKFSRKQELEGELFLFNPNELDSSGWLKLGFSPRETTGILKYRAKGGKFRIKEDVRKLYCVREDRYNRLFPYIDLPAENVAEIKSVETLSTEADKKTDLYRPLVIELNTADTTELKKLKGIGSFYAKKIVEYREELGGYIDEDQLLEIWKFGDERLDNIRQNIIIDTLFVNKIDVNTLDKEAPRIHPYISSQLAGMMVNYRLHHGHYKRASDLKKLILMNDSIYLRLLPYLNLKP